MIFRFLLCFFALAAFCGIVVEVVIPPIYHKANYYFQRSTILDLIKYILYITALISVIVLTLIGLIFIIGEMIDTAHQMCEIVKAGGAIWSA